MLSPLQSGSPPRENSAIYNGDVYSQRSPRCRGNNKSLRGRAGKGPDVARCGQMWPRSSERCVSRRKSKNEPAMCQGSRVRTGSMWGATKPGTPHLHPCGDRPQQLYQLHSSSLQRGEKKPFLAGMKQLAGFSELPVRLCTPKHTLYPKPQQFRGTCPPSPPTKLRRDTGVSTKLVLWKGLWL